MKSREFLSSLFLAAQLGSAVAYAHEGHNHHKDQGVHAAADSTNSATRVAVKLFQFQPERTQVGVGSTVTWINEDEIYHSVTAAQKEAGFDAQLEGKGKSFSFTFMEPGIFTYHCDRHEHMRGEIEVR